MIDLPHNSSDAATQPAVSHAANLLRHYSFELEVTVEQQMAAWLKTYPEPWILLSVVEALYQGRYKAVSVEQILQIWQRRGQPLCHFTHEFEQLVGSKIPLAIAPSTSLEAKPQPLPQPTLSYRTMLLQLPSVKAAFKLKRLTEIPSLTFPLNSKPDAAIASELSASELSAPESSSKPRLPGESDREFQQFKEGVIFALSSSLATHTLHPVIRLQLSQSYRLNWQHFLESQAPCV